VELRTRRLLRSFGVPWKASLGTRPNYQNKIKRILIVHTLLQWIAVPFSTKNQEIFYRSNLPLPFQYLQLLSREHHFLHSGLQCSTIQCFSALKSGEICEKCNVADLPNSLKMLILSYWMRKSVWIPDTIPHNMFVILSPQLECCMPCKLVVVLTYFVAFSKMITQPLWPGIICSCQWLGTNFLAQHSIESAKNLTQSQM